MEPYEQLLYSHQAQLRGLTEEGPLRAAFSKWSRTYHGRLKDFLPKDRKAKFLDLPCGYGNFLFFLIQEGYTDVGGFDLDPGQVALAKKLNLPARQGDAFQVLTESKDCFDCISSLDFLEHVTRDQAVTFLQLCRRRLSPGGVLLVRTPSADGPFGAHDRYNDLTHQWGLTANSLEGLLKAVGFEQVRILDERPVPYNFVNLLRRVSFSCARRVAAGMCLAMGMQPPRIWSRSMWGVAFKPFE